MDSGVYFVYIQGVDMKSLLFFIGLILFTNMVKAAGPDYYNSQVVQKTHNYTILTSSDQERCQAEANYMASNNISGHVWGTIGNFEGVGYGSSPNCNTCVPSRSMRLTGDASAQGRNGMWYRVRSWR
jgi:hypothetical protein